MTRRRLVTLAVVALAASACGGSDPVAAPSSRAVEVRTTACGDASRTTGSGVIVADGLVVTAAHVVIGATEVAVVGEGTGESQASVVVLDTVNDVALLDVDGVDGFDDVELSDLVAGQPATLVGGASSGDVEVEVLRRVMISVDEVRSTAIVERDGYEIRGSIESGDSGSGIFDADGALGAVLFAEPSVSSGVEAADADRAFATAAGAVEALLTRADRQVHECDPTQSRLVVVE